MKVEVLQPAERLRGIVRSYTVIETDSAMETTVLPHLGLVLAIQVQGAVSSVGGGGASPIAAVTVSGMRKTFRRFLYHAGTVTILVSFTEAGAYSIFSEAVFELFESAAPLDSVLKPSLCAHLTERIAAACSNARRVAIIDSFLLHALQQRDADKLVLAAQHRIHASNGLIRIKDLCGQLSISQDLLEKRFRNAVGATPKHFATIVKMKAISRYQHADVSLTDMAYTFGFYDQSHFIRQFKDFTGQTPGHFFKTPYAW